MITEEQRLKRKNGIGASDSPIIMGFSSYKTPYELYLEKIGVIDADNKESEQQYWGNALESTILNHFSVINNVPIETPDTIYHPKYDFIFANLDGYVREWNAVVEIKCANSFMRSEWDDAFVDGIPMQYLIQIAKQVACMDADIGYCAVLIGGNEYRQYTYIRDKELEEMIIESDIKFWECVKNRIEPECITMSDIRLKHPKSYGAYKVADDKTCEMLMALARTKDISKLVCEEMDSYKLDIMKYMGNSDTLTDLNGTILATWKETKNGNRVLLIK